jgi:[ribosomal protein S18]-alanine N-acetyltransferase
MELPKKEPGAYEMPVFRPMRVDDIETICEIEKEAFPTPWTAGAFHNELKNNHFAYYLVMEMEGTIAGYAGMWLIMDEAHITNIAVRLPFRGKKLGESLLSELGWTARSKGARRMTLEVRVTNKVAQNLYEKMGFRSVGVRKGYYTDNNEDALIMWADIPEERW